MGPGGPVRSMWGAALGTWAVARSWDASTLSAHRWAAVIGVLAVAWVAVVAPVVQRWWPQPGAVPAMVGGALFAIYCCVPETDQIPRVAAAVAITVAVEVGARRTLPWWAVTALFAWVMWTGLFGATGRESALVGASFAVWPFVLVPIAVVFANSFADSSAGSSADVPADRSGEGTVGSPVSASMVMVVVVVAAAVGAVATVAVARTGALEPVVRPAVVAVLVAVVASLAVAAAVVRVLAGRAPALPGSGDQK